jgi:hypothetical protein
MKTTIDIADNIMVRSKELAQKKKSTFRDLVKEGLLLMIDRRSKAEKIHVKPVTVNGCGLTGAFETAFWQQIRLAAYEGHGS